MVEAAEALALSVREDEPKTHLQSSLWWYGGRRDDLLAAYGSMERERQLRWYWQACHNTLAQGATSNLVKRIAATPWEITGKRYVRHFQDVLQQAEFGAGYKTLLKKMLVDYFTQDGGGVIEIIGRGNKEKPLSGQVEGLAHLDRWRCAFTGSTEHPVAYFPRKGGVIYLHRTRVKRFVDMPSSDEDMFNNGQCALSRVAGLMNSQILMGRYQGEKLGNEPPAGLIVFSNVKPQQVDDVKQMHDADRSRDGTNTYNPIQYLEAMDPANPVSVEFVPFAQLPDHFDEEKYSIVHVNKLALALGEDPQEIWPLTGQPLGTGTQSMILDAKGKAKTFGDLLDDLTIFFNMDVLPENLEYRHKHRDANQDRQTADTAKVWSDVATSLTSNGNVDTEMANQLLANQVPAFADVLLDEAGQVRLPSDDQKPEQPEVIVVNNTTDAVPAQPAGDAPVIADSTTDLPESEQMKAWAWHTDDRVGSFTKDFQETRVQFIRNMTDLFKGVMDGDMSRRRAGTVMRAQLTRLGRQAMIDGLADGGVEVEALDEEDARTLAGWLAEQSEFVTNFLNKAFDGATFDAEDRAIMWTRKSLQAIYLEGVASADKNGLYEFYGPDGEESCSTCTTLKGQKHRLKEWIKKQFRPQVDTNNFECGGWRCEHDLRKTTGQARGRWPKAA